MVENIQAGTDRHAAAGLHVVFGSGGTRAILGGAGAILAFHVTGVNSWKTVGGISGGSIPAVLLADSRHPRDVLRMATETEFTSLLKPYTTWLGRVFALLSKYRHERDLPRRGVFSWEPLSKLMDKEMPRWPDKFWTFAVSRTRKVLFTADGVITYDGARKDAVMSTTPAAVGTAICATCAVPGIIDAVPFGDQYLWDGALSDDGACPVDMAKRHFGATSATIIAFDVGEEEIKKSWLLRFIWNLACGGRCKSIDARHPDASDGVVLIEPKIVGFHALKFRLGRDLKWGAVIAGFVATVDSLARAGILKGPALAKAQSFSQQLKLIETSSKKYGELTARTQAFLSEQGLY